MANSNAKVARDFADKAGTGKPFMQRPRWHKSWAGRWVATVGTGASVFEVASAQRRPKGGWRYILYFGPPASTRLTEPTLRDVKAVVALKWSARTDDRCRQCRSLWPDHKMDCTLRGIGHEDVP
jgi:hypothetical protein